MANAITSPVLEVIRQRLQDAEGKRLPWVDVMQSALYEENTGYYRSGVRRIGRGGDFYTSVSVGPLYGELLADFVADAWQRMGRPDSFGVVEQGAHDGTLAADVLAAVQRSHPELFEKVRYVLVEPAEVLREAQRQTMRALPTERFQQIRKWSEWPSALSHAVVICNELLDAFAVHRIQFLDGRWQESYVQETENGGLEFVAGPLSSDELMRETTHLGMGFREGYTAEVNTAMLAWIRELANAPFEGLVYLADYGHAAAEQFSEERGSGTLRCYHKHRNDGGLLENLGQQDITAHVNFTRLVEEAQEHGFALVDFMEQGRFLTHVAANRLGGRDFQASASWLRQFQSLTHPNHLGHSFHSLILAKGVVPAIFSHATRTEAARRRLGGTL